MEVIGFFLVLAIYFLPALIAMSRNTGNAIAVFLVCLFFGWSLIGWLIALIMAFGRQSPTTVVNIHQYAAPPPPEFVPPQQPATLDYAPSRRLAAPRTTVTFGQRR
jgi:hypothetical protein